MQFGRKSVILGSEDKLHFETNIFKPLKVQTWPLPLSPLFTRSHNRKNGFFKIVLSVFYSRDGAEGLDILLHVKL